jgi:hypothetical protein
MTPDLRDEAVKRLRKKQDFHAHVLVFVLINAVIWMLWALTDSDGFPWAVFLTAFWGIGLVMNGWDVYARRPFTEAQIRAEVERLESDADDYGPHLRHGSDEPASHRA